MKNAPDVAPSAHRLPATLTAASIVFPFTVTVLLMDLLLL
jgi:hypothetical protein